MTERMSSEDYRKQHCPWEKAGAAQGISGKIKRPRKKPQQREAAIQTPCHDLMVQAAPSDCVYLSIPNEQMGGKGRGGRMNAMGRMAGAADYWIYYQGVMTFIEFKCPKDVHGDKTYLKPAQSDFRDLVNAMPRTRYAVCRSIEEFVIVVKPIGLLPNYRLTGAFRTMSLAEMQDYRLREMQS